MHINDPAVIAELTGLHQAYEKALIANDVQTLDAFFWDSPHAIRLGVTENLHGAGEIRAFRLNRPSINLDRQIERLDITSFGDMAGVINLEFVRSMDGTERRGRQTQFWFRFPEGWRIASAHVSLLLTPKPPPAITDAYVEAAAKQIGLPLDEKERGAVTEDLKRVAAIAGFLMQFPLPQEMEAAPVFQS
jgi:hypothetical protein